MIRFASQVVLILAVCVTLTAAASAQAQFATQVLSFNQGALGGGIFNPANVLGGPDPSDFQGVLSLGEGGDVTLGFGVTIVDGPGADFSVFENGFEFPSGSGMIFSEVVFVEVSSNGIDFARFPTTFGAPSVPHLQFNATAMGSYDGFAGGTPVLADVGVNSIDPANPAISGGDAFDLARLASDPLVTSNLVDLQNISFLRLVDVVAGQAVDSSGVTVYDDFGSLNDSADINAVAVINHAGNQSALSPDIVIDYDALGRIEITIFDPSGLGALVSSSFILSANFIPLTTTQIAQFFDLVSILPNEITLRSKFVIPGSTIPTLVLGSSIENLSQKKVAAQFSVQP
ncbi:MAG: hypothetical protein V3W41_20905 [Planctomycetota bacterium]